jgi:RNA polymerase sigma-70 factor (ECF subfamily)
VRVEAWARFEEVHERLFKALYARRVGRPDLNESPPSSIHGRVQAEDDVVELRREREAPVGPLSFEELFLDQHDRLYRALYFITGSREDAEELMQDAFLKLWEQWDTIGSIDDPVAWLFRVALNGFRMRARRARLAARRLVPAPGAHDPFEDVNIREDVRRMLRSIPQRQRAALVLTQIFEFSSEQAAQILGIRPTTVRVLASQGRAALRAT